ncbi:MAG: DUF6765 family protein [Spirochaetales bacterium]
MNAEFHYYMVAMIARRAGFTGEQADELAYASQYTDHALVSYQVRGPGVKYDTVTTHHFGFWDKSQEYQVWIPFHFVPGDAEAAARLRSDRRKNALVVTPNGARAKELLVSALKTRNIMRIGIALHTFADTWAHQNFTGRNEEFNRFDQNSLVPPIGHAHAGRAPDKLEQTWEDPRLIPDARRIHNRSRFFAAARKVYRYLATYNRRSFEDEELVLSELESIIGAPGNERPYEERTLDFIIREDIAEYRRNEWKGEAVELDDSTGDEELGNMMDKYLWLKHEIQNRTGAKPRTVRPKPGFFKSRYYRWHEAAKEHYSEAVRVLRDLRLPDLK